MADFDRAWETQLAALRRRTQALRATLGPPPALVGDTGPRALARVRREARPTLEAIAAAYEGLCPAGFPLLEDNGIDGPGGSIGVRFSSRHAVYVALEPVKPRRQDAPAPDGLAGALGVRLKRLPGQPLPPPDPHRALELVVLGLRFDDDRGWVEVRRRLDPRWDEALLREHLAAYLLGFTFDVVAGLPDAAG